MNLLKSFQLKTLSSFDDISSEMQLIVLDTLYVNVLDLVLGSVILKKTLDVLQLRPTQFAVGMLEVDEKIAELKKLSKKELKKYIKNHLIPVIISPTGEFYLTDHHHFLAVCWHMGIERVKVEVIADLSKEQLNFSQFWRWMRKNKYVYPYCQFGEGPREELYLPSDIRGVADDPYRSMAWFVRKAGGFDNSDKNFAEFKWANFFRAKRLLSKSGKSGFENALKKAIKLAKSSQAKGLPGYGKLN